MSQKTSLFGISIIFVFLLIFPGCDSKNGSDPITSTAFFPPVASGMWISNYFGPYPIGQWGNPTSNFVPYPNPFNDRLDIPFYVDQPSSTVRVWIVRALSPYEEENRTNLIVGSGVIRLTGNPVFHYDYFQVEIGNHVISWIADGLPSGFYRVYVEINGVLEFTDVFLAVNPWDLPNDLDFLNN